MFSNYPIRQTFIKTQDCPRVPKFGYVGEGESLNFQNYLIQYIFFMFKISFCACNRLEYMFVFCFSKRKRNRKEKHNKTKKVLRGGLPILMDVGMNERRC